MATASETTGRKSTLKTFALACPKCGAGVGAEANDDRPEMALNLNDLAAGVQCGSCGESITAKEAEDRFVEQAERWAKVGRWLALAAEA